MNSPPINHLLLIFLAHLIYLFFILHQTHVFIDDVLEVVVDRSLETLLDFIDVFFE